MPLLEAGMPCYGLLFNATHAPFTSPQRTTPALPRTDPGLAPGVQSFVNRVETCNLRGGRPIAEGRQWPIMELSLHSPHPIGRALAFLIGLHRHWVDRGHIYRGTVLWRTGGASVEGD
jgi:hypothetical protein